LGNQEIARLILKKIRDKEVYIEEQTSLTLKKAKIFYKKLQQENTIREKQNVQILYKDAQVRYKNEILKLNNETIFIKNQLYRMKYNFVTMILKKLYRN
jgi:hypothetical protein